VKRSTSLRGKRSIYLQGGGLNNEAFRVSLEFTKHRQPRLVEGKEKGHDSASASSVVCGDSFFARCWSRALLPC